VGGPALVSDALKGAAQPGAEFESHGRRCQVRGGAIYLVGEEPPRLTGAEACQLEAVRRLVKAGVVSAAEALTMASATPARALGLERELGHLAVGARADLIVLAADTLALEAVHVG
jgi:N-acetylglucosamine-6-phosphate deacetylase